MAFDIKELDQTQLALLSQIDPQAVKEEMARRSAYDTMVDGLADVGQAALEVENFLASIKNTAATKAVKESLLLDKVRRLLATAKREGFKFKEPSL